MQKYRLPVFIGTLAVSVVSIVCMLLWGFTRKPASEPGSSLSPAPSASTVAVLHRILGQWNGTLAIFVAGGQTPDEVYDVYVSTLPAEEQTRLRDGIPIYSEEELARLLEDYTS